MHSKTISDTLRLLAAGIMMTAAVVDMSAQTEVRADSTVTEFVTAAGTDGAETMTADSIATALATADSMLTEDARWLDNAMPAVKDTVKRVRPKRNWETWRPNPQRALWLAMVLPGAGQIYNRKYWKLPIFYGGMMGCLYAMNWNNMMYKDYSQAYLDIMDDDPTTESYNKFLHLGRQINTGNEERYKKLFKSRKDKYRRWRDLSFFCLVGVYALSVIDAYVDAELSEFDISKDLSLKVEPAIINGRPASGRLDTSALGLQCSLKF